MLNFFKSRTMSIFGGLKTAAFLALVTFYSFAPVYAQSAQQQTIVFGIAPWDTTENLIRKHQPLMDYLAEKLKVKTKLVVTRDYGDLEQQLNSGTLHIGFMPAVSYVKARRNMPGLIILAGVTDQHPVTGEYRDHYRGIIVALKSSGITTLTGLKNKRFGFTDKDSSSGYKYPMQLLSEKGIDAQQFFAQVFMLKKHPKVTQALLAGAIDGGATFDVHLAQEIEKHGDIFNIIAQTSPIPFDAVVASPHFSRSKANSIKALLLGIKPDSPVLQQMRQHGLATFGWKATNDSNYNSVRRIIDSHLRNNNIKQLILGITEDKAAYQMHKMWLPLLHHISKETNIPMTLQVVKNDSDLALRMENGQFDIGIFRAFAYIRAKKKLPQLHYLATLTKPYADGRIANHYNGVLIALKNNHINTLADLKNKRFAFTSKGSTSGYLYPMAFLKQHDINTETFFAQTFLLNKHNKVVKALLSNAVDAGATTDDELYRATLKYGDIFNVISQTSDIPFDAITAAPHVNKPLRQTIKRILLSLKDNPALLQKLKQSQWKYSGFTQKNNAFYDSVRQVRDTMSQAIEQ